MQTLSKPPIKEAILEVLLSFPEDFDSNFLSDYGKIIENEFPFVEPITKISGSFGSEKKSIVTEEKIGNIYFTKDRNTSLQVRLDGFSFSVINQTYSSWEKFSPEAFRQFFDFISYSQPSKYSRISLRFINEIKIPSGESLEKYLKFLPALGNLKLPFQNIISRIELFNEEINSIAILSEVISPPFEPTINIFFDIDVITKIESLTFDKIKLSNEFEQLRQFKNNIFSSSLTELALEMYK